MDFKTFLENFDAIAEAPGGIPKLRLLILDLAVRGKLAAQNSGDEAASVLSNKSKFQREQWIEAGKIRKSKQLPPVSQEEVPYQPPQGWEWCRFSNVVFFQEGPGIRNWQFRATGIKLLNVKNIVQGELVLENSDKYISEEEFNQKYRHFLIEEGDLLFASSGNSWGKTAFFKDPGYRVIVNTSTIRMRFFLEQCSNQYLRYFLDSDLFKHQMQVQLEGIQPNFGSLHLTKVVIPLPPLAEQKRIVEKVDELMGLCDRYEAAKQTRDNLRQKLRGSAITSLMDAKTNEELDAAWAFVRDTWQNLSQQPEDVDELRQAVLQLATRGKIVAQNPNDKPAYTLLEAIENERQILLKKRKIQKPKKLPLIQSDELPFEIPKFWEWTRLGELCFQVSDGPHFSPNYVSKEEGIPFLSTRNIRADGVRLDSAKYISKSDYEEFCKRIKPEVGDILYTKGGTTGIATVNNLDIEFTVWVHVAILRIAKNFIYPQYLAHVLNSPHCYALSQKYTHGSSNKDLGLTRMILITIPLPPLAEQKRIVAKVDELMQLCDKLEASLRQSKQRAENLAVSAISHLTI